MMRYSMMILFDFDYRINNIIDDLKDYDKHCEEREKEELDQWCCTENIIREWRGRPPLSTEEIQKKVLEDTAIVEAGISYFLFPDCIIRLSNTRNVVVVIEMAKDNMRRCCITIDDTFGNPFFEFVLGKGNEVITHYRREKSTITILQSVERINEFFHTYNDSNFDFLLDTTLSYADIANKLSVRIKIPLLFCALKNDILLLSNMTSMEELATCMDVRKMDNWRPVFCSPNNYSMETILSDYHAIFRSKYMAIYEPKKETLQKFSYKLKCKSEKMLKPILTQKRINPYDKITCLHLVREDLPGNALKKLVKWCEQYLYEYRILIENHYIGIWCLEWCGESDERCYYHLSKSFNCRVIGFWMHDDLFFSLNLMKDRKVIAGASFGEGGPSINNAALAKQEFGIELPLLENYDDANTFLEKIDCFTIRPENNSLAEKIEEHPHGIVYNLSSNI